MGIEFKINTREIDELIKDLEGVNRSDVLLPSAKVLAEKLADLPRKQAGAFTAMATPGQRRAYWAKVRNGQAKHGDGGYIRSDKLSKGWKAQKVNQFAVKAINKVSYAAWVYGDKEQQPFHAASGFPKESEAAKKYEKDIARAIEKEIDRILA